MKRQCLLLWKGGSWNGANLEVPSGLDSDLPRSIAIELKDGRHWQPEQQDLAEFEDHPENWLSPSERQVYRFALIGVTSNGPIYNQESALMPATGEVR